LIGICASRWPINTQAAAALAQASRECASWRLMKEVRSAVTQQRLHGADFSDA
jgi:hypothetical protein